MRRRVLPVLVLLAFVWAGPARGDDLIAPSAIGVIKSPIIYFSVNLWNTLHQGATIRLL